MTSSKAGLLRGEGSGRGLPAEGGEPAADPAVGG